VRGKKGRGRRRGTGEGQQVSRRYITAEATAQQGPLLGAAAALDPARPADEAAHPFCSACRLPGWLQATVPIRRGRKHERPLPSANPSVCSHLCFQQVLHALGIVDASVQLRAGPAARGQRDVPVPLVYATRQREKQKGTVHGQWRAV
jgi:hypothetical protein